MGCKPSKSKGPADPVDEPARMHATAGALEATSAPTAGAVTIEGDDLDVMLPSFDLDALEEQDAAARSAAEAENAKAENAKAPASAPEAAPSVASVEVKPENAVAIAAANESAPQTQAPLAPAPAEAPAETPVVTPAMNEGEEAARALREANESLARMTEREEEARRGWEAASDDARQLRATLVAERECYAAELNHLARVLKVRPHADSPSSAITMGSSRWSADLACCRRLRPPKLLTAALAPHLASSRRRTRSKTHRSPRPTCVRWSRAAPSEARS